MPTRPPFTGIHEIFPNSGGNVPHEGGGDLPPFGEDLFQRVVDINFGGGEGAAIFTAGDYCCYIRSGTVPFPPDPQAWIGVGAQVFTSGGSCNGGTSAVINGRPIFLMCGASNVSGCVAASHDGYHFFQTYGFTTEEYAFELYPYMMNLIWDAAERTFYGQTNGWYGNTFWVGIYISNDGYNWVKTSLTEDDFWSHCQNPFGEPDGVVGYNPETDKWIHPDDVKYGDIEGLDHTVDNYYTRKSVDCVAFAGGIWCASGFGLIPDMHGPGYSGYANYFATSFDDGETWALAAYGRMGNGGDYGNPDILGIAMEHFTNA